jgi:two-component system chemotaxis response regulator CheY
MALKASMKILLVCENAGKRQTNRGMLRKIGFKNVVEAADGEKALATIKESAGEEPVGLMIIDAELPKLSGLEVVKAVRADAAISKTRILFVLAEADQKLVVEAAQARVNEIIVSPFSSNGIMEKIGKIFGQNK